MPRGGSRVDAFNRHREAVLDAALELFTEQGVAATSIAQIREISGTPTGSIYHHFGSKEGIAGELYVRALISYQLAFVRAVEPVRSARELIEAGVRQHIAWVRANRRRAIFLDSGREALSLRYVETIRKFNRGFFEELKELLAPHIEAGLLPDLTLDLLEAIWLGPSQELTRHWLAGRVKTLEGAADVLAEAAWKSLTTDKEK